MIEKMMRLYFRLIVTLLFFVSLILAYLATDDSTLVIWIEQASKGIARVDDLILRVFGLLMLVWAVALFFRDFDKIGEKIFTDTVAEKGKESKKEISETTTIYDIESGKEKPIEKRVKEGSEESKPKETDLPPPVRPYFALIKIAAVLGLSGASLFGSYELDSLDRKAYPPKSDPPVQTGSGPVVPVFPKNDILARWVQIVPAGKQCWLPPSVGDGKRTEQNFSDCDLDFLVRVVVPPPATCPSVEIRYAGDNIRKLVLRKRGNPNLDQYPIQVCEEIITHRDSAIAVRFPDGGSIPLPDALRTETEGPRSVAIFGDSGCRDDREQDCVGLKWPFKSLAGDMAGKGPDLVIHLGDYIYGGGDHWSAWFHEFFRPARKLLEAAPWVMVRGNHESCGDDAPRGWLLFFDYRPDGKTDTCASTDKNHLVATYAIDLSNKLRLIVADSSKSFLKLNKKMKKKLVGGIENCNQLGGFEVMCVRYKKIFDDVELLAKDKNRKTWFATHVPVFGVEEDDKEAVFPETTAMMMAAWRTAKIGKKPDLLFSGDRHLFQIAEVDGKPFQITVGSGGVNLDPAPPDEMDKREGPLAKEEWNVCNDERFGYLLAARMKDGFSFSFNPLMMGDGKCAGMLGMLNKGN